ncbi:MAG: hypothetical protein DSO07_01305, partial [Thermoproteota archaeon]
MKEFLREVSLLGPLEKNKTIKFIITFKVDEKGNVNVSAYEQVKQFLINHNITIKKEWANRVMLEAEGKVADIEKTLGAEINVYKMGNKTFYMGISKELLGFPGTTLPNWFLNSTAGIVIDNMTIESPFSFKKIKNKKDILASIKSPAPQDLWYYYGVKPFIDAGWSKGMKIGIVVAYGDPNLSSDLSLFQTYYNLPSGTNIIIINPGNVKWNDDWSPETALDVEWASAMAPKADIYLSVASDASSGSMYGAINDLITNYRPNVISISWGADEEKGCDWLLRKCYDVYHSIFINGYNNGIRFYAASGDYGAYANPEMTKQGVIYPASDDLVVAVGGTVFYSDQYYYEEGWEYSGGGCSKIVPKPSYQSNAGISLCDKRAVPDIALVSYNIEFVAGGKWYLGSGTSFAAPIAAGMAAVARSGGWYIDGNSLYAYYGDDLKYKLIFYDIKSGNNGIYTASTKWDAVTGLGSLDLYNFIAVFSGKSLSLDGYYLSPNIVNSTGKFYLYYLLSSQLAHIGLGADIRQHGSTTWLWDAKNDVLIDFTSSGSTWYNRAFDLKNTQSSPAAGYYDVEWDVFHGAPGKSSSNLLYSPIKENSLVIDSNPPTVTITSGPSGITKGDVSFTWTGSDDYTSTSDLLYSYYLEGYDSGWSSWTSSTSKTYNGLPAGKSYTFRVKAKDKAGNVGPESSRSFTVYAEVCFYPLPSGLGTIVFNNKVYSSGCDLYNVGTYSAEANPSSGGWIFDTWESGVASKIYIHDPSSRSTLVDVSGNGNLIAKFDALVTFYTNPQNLGSITVSGSGKGTGTYYNGQQGAFDRISCTNCYTITANVPSGYSFAGWSTTGYVSVGDPSKQSTSLVVNGPGTITVNWKAQYQLIISSSDGGTTNPAPGSYWYDP